MEVISDQDRIDHLAANLTARMHRSGLSQSKLAQAIGVPQTSISRILRKENQPLLSVVCRLADYFETSVDLLVAEPPTAKSGRSLAKAS